MALFRRLFYRKPPDRLLEISDRVYVFDCCFSSEIMEDNEYKNYLGFIVAELQDHFPDTSFMVCNFREGDKKSHISDILSEYDMTVMDYPRQYERCPLLPLEMIHHFLKSSESWLSLEGQHNVLLMHCERGGWPVLAFILAGFLLYRKQYTGEQKTLEMVYKQAPKELLHLFCPLNPQPSHLRYLQYITRQGGGLEWSPKDKPFLLKCIILSVAPHFDGKGGCRPVVRVYGQDPQTPTNRTSMILFSTPKTKNSVRHYIQEESAEVKLNARCHVRGDVIIECIHVDEDLAHEEVMCRIMFNTAFIESDMLLLNRNEIDVAWNAKDQFPRDFKAEVIFSDLDAAESEVISKATTTDDHDDEREGGSIEEFFEAEEIFNNSEMHVDTQLLRTKNILDVSGPNSDILVTDNVEKKLKGTFALENNNTIIEKLKKIDRMDAPFEPSITEDQVESTFEASVSEHDVISEKIINLDNVIALEEKRILESGMLMRKKDTFCSKVDGEFTSKYGNVEPKTIYTSEINFTQTTVTVDIAGCKMENLTLTNEGNSRMDSSSVSRESMKSAVPQRASILDGRDLKNASSNRANRVYILDGRGCNSSDQSKHEIDIDDCKHGTRSDLKVYYDSRMETPDPADQEESGSEITIHDKAIITEKLISLHEMNEVEENDVVEINNLKEEGVVALLNMEPKGTTETTHLKFVVGVFTHKDSEDDTIDKPNTLILDAEAKSVLERSDSKNDLEKISICKEFIRDERTEVVSCGSVLNKTMCMPGSVDYKRDNSRKARESLLLTQMIGSGTKIQNNEKVWPFMSEKNLTQNKQSEPIIAKNKCIQQEASNLIAKTAKTKLVPRWISPKRISDATSVHWPSNPLSSASDFDVSELECLFSAVTRKSDDSSKADAKRKSLGSKSDKVHLIELRRANNTEIMLTKVKMPLPDLMSAALALDDSVLDVDQVENLIKFCPTKEEMELLKGYTGEKEKLGKCEQFFLELMKVPRVESKLRVFSFKIQFHQQIADLRKSLNTIDSACEQIRSSDKLKEIMKKILYLGNTLNQGTARGLAIGFRLDSLLKLSDTRATNNKMTLMHYLCKVIALRSSYLLDFHEDLTSLESASKIQLKSLAEEMQAIVKGLEKVELELTASESDGPVSSVFRKTLKGFTAVADAEVRSLASLYSAVGRNADALAIYFGEDPARCSFEQVISTLRTFALMFRRAHQENCKEAELEKKKAQKEAEINKSKSSKSIK